MLAPRPGIARSADTGIARSADTGACPCPQPQTLLRVLRAPTALQRGASLVPLPHVSACPDASVSTAVAHSGARPYRLDIQSAAERGPAQ